MFRKHVLTPQDLQSNEHYNSVTMTTMPCHCNVSLLCSLTPAAFRTLTADKLNNQFWIFKIFLFIPFRQKTPSFHYKCFLWPILFNICKIQSWTKMLRKIHLVCLILEYFTLKTGTLKILPPPPKNNVEGSPEHFWSRLNNTDQGGEGGGATMMLNSLGVSPVHNKV